MPRTASTVLALAVFVTVGVVLLGPAAGVVNDNTGVQTVENETVYADYDDPVDLRGYSVQPDSETVWGYNDTAASYEQATSPDDYTVNDNAGTIEFNSSSTLIDSGEEVKVSYDYEAAGSIASLILGFVPLAIGLLLFVGVANRVTGML